MKKYRNKPKQSTSNNSPLEELPIILIVEDNPDLADVFRSALEDEYTVRVADTGEQALTELYNDIDIVLLDRELEDWSGEELLNVIENRRLDCGIIMTTSEQPDFDIVNLNIDKLLQKPIYLEDLREAIEELLLWSCTGVDRQGLLALISRKIALEQEKTDAELEESQKYSKLEQRIKIATTHLDLDTEAISSTESKYRPSTCTQCDLCWDVSVGETVGFLKLGSSVWKCTNCGHIQKYHGPGESRLIR